MPKSIKISTERSQEVARVAINAILKNQSLRTQEAEDKAFLELPGQLSQGYIDSNARPLKRRVSREKNILGQMSEILQNPDSMETISSFFSDLLSRKGQD